MCTRVASLNAGGSETDVWSDKFSREGSGASDQANDHTPEPNAVAVLVVPIYRSMGKGPVCASTRARGRCYENGAKRHF